MTTRSLRSGEFAKYHALGNDYLVIDGEVTPLPSVDEVRAICSRHTGLGSDGLLVRLKPKRGGAAALRIFNPDGSEAEKSGNGLRIFARFLLDGGYAEGPSVQIELPGETIDALCQGEPVHRAIDSEPRTIEAVVVSMGMPAISYEAVQASVGAGSSLHVNLIVGGESLDATLVGLGNPHCVIFHTTLDAPTLARLGPQVERHAQFPARINVQLAKVVARNRLSLRIWERGAGATQASGSSSCAAVAAAQARGLCDDRVVVEMPGGEVTVERQPTGHLTLEGPATPVARMFLWRQS